VVPLGDGSLPLQAIASPIRFDGYTPSYGLPPLLDEHRTEVLGKPLP
jgi:CoA:oxalate CoA-transferase